MHEMGFSVLLACILVALIAIHVVLVLLHESKRRRVSPPPATPGPAGHPVLGNLLYVIGPLRCNQHRALAALAAAHGPVVSLRLGPTRAIVVVSSPAAAREALATHDAALAARLVPDNVRALSYGATSLVFLPSCHRLWRQSRAVVGPGFSTSRGLDKVRPVLERHTGRLADHFRARAGEPVVVMEALNGAVLNVISNVLFSRDVVEDIGSRAQVFRGLVAPVLEGWSKPSVCDAFPFLAPLEHLLGSSRRISLHLAKLFKFFDEEIIEPRLATGGEQQHDDLLDVLLARHAKSRLTRQQITTFLTDMFIAASDTSTVTVQRAMAELHRNPAKMEKVRTEIAVCLGSSNYVRESDLDKLPYLQAVVKETLRLHPAVPLIPREVVADGVSLGGFPVPIGTGVVVNLWAIGRDRTAWPQPEEFMPERFLDEKVVLKDHGVDFSYRPFGAGRRVCTGMDYTARSVPVLLASLLHKMEWRLPYGMEPEDMELHDRYGTVLDLATPLCAIPVPIM